MINPETKILIVDDYAMMRTILKKNLIELGFNNITEANDGAPAWDYLESAKKENTPFDMIISDWSMPNMCGIELLKLCHEDVVYKSKIFIMVTAEAEKKSMLQAIKLGCTEYIFKPFKSNEIKLKILETYSKFNKSKVA